MAEHGRPRVAVAHRATEAEWAWVLPRLERPPAVRSYQVGVRGQSGLSDRALEVRTLRRLRRDHAERPFDLVLSFDPFAAMRVGLAIGRAGRHDCFAFNFTDLPGGAKAPLFRLALRGLEQAYVLTRAERALYAEAFGLPEQRFVQVDWGVTPPKPGTGRVADGEYVAALGGEARDYATLAACARLMPQTRFVLVARPPNVAGLDLPDNVTVHTDLPGAEAWNVVAHGQLHVLPLRSRETPCGIVTLVGAMHLGKAQVATEAVGVGDYAKAGEHALFVPPRDPEAMRDAIGKLLADEAGRRRMGEAAAARAEAEFGEDATLRFAQRLVDGL